MTRSNQSTVDTLTHTVGAAGQVGPSYLLVIHDGSSAVVPLPPRGAIVIGRAADADLQVSDVAASRKHASLAFDAREVRVADLGSHNGTRVNGERISGSRVLLSGDVIGIGETMLVLHRGRRPAGRAEGARTGDWRARVGAAIRRALSEGRPLTLVTIPVGGPVGGPVGDGGDRDALVRATTARLGAEDQLMWGDDGHLLLLLAAEDSTRVATEIVGLLGALVPEVRAGAATCPGDACDADTLVAAARGALRGATAGEVASAAATTLRFGDRAVVIGDPVMGRLYDLIRRLARGDLPVLISGETGVGKENAAFAVHHFSPRVGGPLVIVNCAAIPESLIESELFGHEKGAFTGAAASKAGLIESAGGGSLFLDEVGDLPLAAQAKLLRVLESRRISRVGEVRERPVDVRFMAATNKHLELEVREGRFRRDLFFRLNAATVVLPPLRDRPRDIPVLARVFLAEASARLGREVMTLTPGALSALSAHSWPGNVRELRNLMEFVATAVEEPGLRAEHLRERLADVEVGVAGGAAGRAVAPGGGGPGGEGPAGGFRPIADELSSLERARMVEALAATEGNQRQAAELLQMPLRTFVHKVRVHGLTPSERRGR